MTPSELNEIKQREHTERQKRLSEIKVLAASRYYMSREVIDFLLDCIAELERERDELKNRLACSASRYYMSREVIDFLLGEIC